MSQLFLCPNMAEEIFPQDKTSYFSRRKGERRRTLRRTEDRVREQAVSQRDQKFHSLLELGQLISLDLNLKEMLSQIAQKACDVMEADRCSLFLHDPNTDELWSTVALGMGEQVIRIPSQIGIAGHCFQTGEIINLEDAYADARFDKDVDAGTGYRTRSLLCMPLCTRAGLKLGVIQLLNKEKGVFNTEDETFLKTFGNHASVFIEMAQLQKARIEALEQSRRELEQLNRVKSKALSHLSHELRTPLSVIQGNVQILKRRLLQMQIPLTEEERFFEMIKKHLNRLLDIQHETEKIIRSHEELEGSVRPDEFDPRSSFTSICLFPFVEQILERVKQRTIHREIQLDLNGGKDLFVFMDPKVLEDVLESLLKNGIENTPDEGTIRILLEERDQKILLKIQDFGIGITEENQKFLFDGLFHTQETDLYTSKRPYDFNAGGKGLDLIRTKVYGRRFGFDLSVESHRCIYLPTNRDLCPGRISICPHCQRPQDCLSSGGSTFCVSFPMIRRNHSEKI